VLRRCHLATQEVAGSPTVMSESKTADVHSATVSGEFCSCRKDSQLGQPDLMNSWIGEGGMLVFFGGGEGRSWRRGRGLRTNSGGFDDGAHHASAQVA
jgi:hypothetical protein